MVCAEQADRRPAEQRVGIGFFETESISKGGIVNSKEKLDSSARVSVEVLREKLVEYGHLPGCFADDCDSALEELELLRDRIDRLEALAGWALTVEMQNTKEWMEGMRDAVNRVLTADGDVHRCVFEHGRLVLKNLTMFVGSNEVSRSYSAPDGPKPLLPPWEQ